MHMTQKPPQHSPRYVQATLTAVLVYATMYGQQLTYWAATGGLQGGDRVVLTQKMKISGTTQRW